MKTPAGLTSTAFYGLTIAAVWLGWEIVKAPVAERAPPSLAVRVAPSSPEVLRRAAEIELGDGRVENAKSLSETSLVKAPFNARTLRVLGLATAREGDLDQADQLLTLAGNWSLRDDPAHGWLIERRLRQGSYASAFAHADTLARRRLDGNEEVYNLFTTAVLSDQRALPALTTVVARQPPWRSDYLWYLVNRPDADAVMLALGLTLADTPNGYSTSELSRVYQHWYAEQRFQAIRLLREKTGRPGRLDDVQNGDFSTPLEDALLPFGWRVDPASGMSAAAIDDDSRPNDIALRVEYDGYARGVVAEQILMLSPGAKVLAAEERIEASPDTSRLRWRIACIENGVVIGQRLVGAATGDSATWKTFRMAFTVPAAGCGVQRLQLETDPGDRRATTIAWFDKFRIGSSTNGRD